MHSRELDPGLLLWLVLRVPQDKRNAQARSNSQSGTKARRSIRARAQVWADQTVWKPSPPVMAPRISLRSISQSSLRTASQSWRALGKPEYSMRRTTASQTPVLSRVRMYFGHQIAV